MDISIVICTYNRRDSLRNVLNDLTNLKVPNATSYEVLVVDNNSNDDTRSAVEAVSSERPGIFTYIFEPRQGQSFARNRGIHLAMGEIVAFTDDDVSLDREWLVEIKRAFEFPHCLGIGGRIIAVWNCEKPRWYVEEGPYRLMAAIVRFDLGDEPCELRSSAVGANMAFRRSAFEKYGLFREDLGRTSENLLGGEDSEFFFRLIQRGERVMYAPKAVVYHPVEEKRKTREYFESWYFNFGRAAMRTHGVPERTVCYLGIPRYLFRQFIGGLAKWLCCVHPRRRFYYKLQLYLTTGAIVESRTRSVLPKP